MGNIADTINCKAAWGQRILPEDIRTYQTERLNETIAALRVNYRAACGLNPDASSELKEQLREAIEAHARYVMN